MANDHEMTMAKKAYRKALPFPSVPSMFALQDFNRLLLHVDAQLLSLPLSLLAQVALSNIDETAPTSSLTKRLERVAGNEGKIMFVRVGAISARTVVVYAIKSFLQVTVFALEPVKGAEMEMGMGLTTSASAGAKGGGQARGRGGFRSFGSVSPDPLRDYEFVEVRVLCSLVFV